MSKIPETRIERLFFYKFTSVIPDKENVRILANGQTKTTAHCLVSGVLKLFWVTNEKKSNLLDFSSLSVKEIKP